MNKLNIYCFTPAFLLALFFPSTTINAAVVMGIQGTYKIFGMGRDLEEAKRDLYGQGPRGSHSAECANTRIVGKCRIIVSCSKGGWHSNTWGKGAHGMACGQDTAWAAITASREECNKEAKRQGRQNVHDICGWCSVSKENNGQPVKLNSYNCLHFKPEEKFMTASELRNEIIGRTFQYRDNNGLVHQGTFFPSGQVAITRKGKIVYKGKWALNGNRICTTYGAPNPTPRSCNKYKKSGNGQFKSTKGLTLHRR